MFIVINRSHVKLAAKTIIAGVATSRIEHALTNHTDTFEEDALSTKVVSVVGGAIVADTAKPHVNKLVDRVADKWAARRSAENTETPEIV